MKNYFKLTILLVFFISIALLGGCKKEDDEEYRAIPDAVYVTSNAVTGTGSTAATTITNSASGKVTVTPAVARVYVNTLKTADVVVNYSISGTAVTGTNYAVPTTTSVTIPAGKWYGDIPITILNTAVTANRTIIVTLTSATNNTQVGIGTDKNYKVFTYTIIP
ncbi:hypothetical protein [Pedobacter mucosus]|uniref:hypothetical protein n=1 Tax=Pedobacter mucosus TaxID=2895286 RepID=UPI001EE3A7AF|nr:hypothetical protein [Pedobacter mucosus]UKT65950.1 hypothetical protein LOK61_09185 [Pedobacter mucosus]